LALLGPAGAVAPSTRPRCLPATRSSSLSSWSSSRAGAFLTASAGTAWPTWTPRSGMLEAGVDRIISQVVDPKLNHIFRPQIERAIHEFLAAQKKAAVPAPPPEPEGQDPPAPSQDTS
ncbi:BOD1 isoform 5, partial [Pan troglodytes]